MLFWPADSWLTLMLEWQEISTFCPFFCDGNKQPDKLWLHVSSPLSTIVWKSNKIPVLALNMSLITRTICMQCPVCEVMCSNKWKAMQRRNCDRAFLTVSSYCNEMKSQSSHFGSCCVFIPPVLCWCCVFRIIYWADKGFTVRSDIKLHRPSHATGDRLLFHPTVALNVSMPSGAARIKKKKKKKKKTSPFKDCTF